jgi:hypothetical protein
MLRFFGIHGNKRQDRTLKYAKQGREETYGSAIQINKNEGVTATKQMFLLFQSQRGHLEVLPQEYTNDNGIHTKLQC